MTFINSTDSTICTYCTTLVNHPPVGRLRAGRLPGRSKKILAKVHAETFDERSTVTFCAY